jgi:nucleotide-binding universal stress UspA family protein
VRRAGLLARQADAELTILHVVDDDQPARLIELECKEAGKILDEQRTSVAELRDIRCNLVVTVGDAFDAILRTAESTSADLIVMGAHRKTLLRYIFVGTTVERVVRSSSCPVLMVNSEAAEPYARVLAAVDMSDVSARAVQFASASHIFDAAEVMIAHAFDPPAKSKMFTASVPQDRVDEYVAQEQLRASEELAEFLKEHGLKDSKWSLHVEEGEPFQAISRMVTEMYPDLLLIGTHSRSGIAKVLLGSVAEQALRELDVDILAVPPAAARV